MENIYYGSNALGAIRKLLVILIGHAPGQEERLL